GTQEVVGESTLARVPRMMAAHDAGHVEELAALVAELAPGASVLARLRAASGGPGEPALAAPGARGRPRGARGRVAGDEKGSGATKPRGPYRRPRRQASNSATVSGE